jgi:ProP effector
VSNGPDGRASGDNAALHPAPPAMPDDDSSPAATAAETPAAAPSAAVAELAPGACGARLAELFPALFGAGAPKPLKLRIQTDIQQRAPATFTRKSLSLFLHRHTTSTGYLIALTRLPTRFDLDGQPAGEISDEHRQAAGAELARRRSVHEARRAAEQATAQREQAAELEARRARATLLRAFETTTLTRANFCALKGIADAELDALLAAARQEREKHPPQPGRPARHGDERGGRGAGPGRPPRQPGRAAQR